MNLTRRNLIQTAGFALAAHLVPRSAFAFQTAAAPTEMLTRMRQQAATTEIKVTKLTDNLFFLQGTGGNQIAQIGPDGKLLIDAGYSTAVPHLLEALAKLDSHPLRMLIDTHWHFDHTDGNAALHEAGAFIVAHKNTRTRLSTPQDLKAFNLHFEPSPAAALPQQTFDAAQTLYFNNDELSLVHLAPAHTDTDIYIAFSKANVIHTGDIWFNGVYPFIDASSGGSLRGVIEGANRILALADAQTKIIPGHGPIGDRAALMQYRDMLSTVADKVGSMKVAGKTLNEVVAAKPTASLDSIWGKGAFKPDAFAAVAYNTLP